MKDVHGRKLLAALLSIPLLLATDARCQDTGWCDGFESYTVGTAPFPPWQDGAGNTPGIMVDGAVARTGSTSLKMFGSLGSCWAATMARPYQGFPLQISMSVRNGSEDLTGCNQFRGSLGLRTGGPQWWNCPCPDLFHFLENGDIRIPLPQGSPTVISGFPLEAWIDISCFLWLAGDSQLHMLLWINGSYIDEFVVPEEPWMSGPAFVDLSCREGSAWFDDVCVNSFGTCIPDTVVIGEPCLFEAGDMNTSGSVDVVDVVGVINRAFRGAELTPNPCNRHYEP